ncbi:MAG: response regulator [Verrucomicrobiota bacterium]
MVDDEPAVRDTLKMALNFEGHTVELAGGGPEALRKLAGEKFDIVFTDFDMPEMLGSDLVRCIKKEYPHQVIVMVTAFADFLSPREKKTNPVDFIIGKPFALETIANALERAHEINKANRKKAGASPPPPSTPP